MKCTHVHLWPKREYIGCVLVGCVLRTVTKKNLPIAVFVPYSFLCQAVSL
jgi:hypothetical protein